MLICQPRDKMHFVYYWQLLFVEASIPVLNKPYSDYCYENAASQGGVPTDVIVSHHAEPRGLRVRRSSGKVHGSNAKPKS